MERIPLKEVASALFPHLSSSRPLVEGWCENPLPVAFVLCAIEDFEELASFLRQRQGIFYLRKPYVALWEVLVNEEEVQISPIPFPTLFLRFTWLRIWLKHIVLRRAKLNQAKGFVMATIAFSP